MDDVTVIVKTFDGCAYICLYIISRRWRRLSSVTGGIEERQSLFFFLLPLFFFF